MITEETRLKLKMSKLGAKNPMFGKSGYNKGNKKEKPNCFTCGIKLKSYQGKRCKHCAHLGQKGQRGSEHPNWKGKNAKYVAIHMWMYSTFGQPEECENCGKTELTGKKINWANISGQYLRVREDWKRLCRSCHTNFDDIINKGWITRKGGIVTF